MDLDNKIDLTKVKYIEQGDIVNKFIDNTLFTTGAGTNYTDVDSTNFKDAYDKLLKEIKKLILQNVKTRSVLDSLSKHSIQYKAELEEKSYYINVLCPKDFEAGFNEHDEPYSRVQKVLDALVKMKDEEYFKEYRENILIAIEQLTVLKKFIFSKGIEAQSEIQVKNIIYSCIKTYTRKIRESSSSKDREKHEYINAKQIVIDSVVDAIQAVNQNTPTIEMPKPLEGFTKTLKRGFCFNRVTKYNNISMIDSFFTHMFVKNYSDLESIGKIDSNSAFKQALRNCTSEATIEAKWNENFGKFISDSIEYKDYITDSADIQIGNTLGEMSLSYYKFYTQDSDDWNILIVDQPEDNISNNNISKELISYLNSIRDVKQLIFVTHNPLLVVNLDVDNVIYIKNINGELSITSGCLEYEDAETNILDIIARNMDGGKESIEKRLKVYGKRS